jgi:hypothetical protein
MRRVFVDGTGITPGTEKCQCGPECEFPCWQRLGLASACTECGCLPFPAEDDQADEELHGNPVARFDAWLRRR